MSEPVVPRIQTRTARELVETFEGPHGRAEVYEVVGSDPAHPAVEDVTYEIIFNGRTEVRRTIGEAAIIACELSGDPRFASDADRAARG